MILIIGMGNPLRQDDAAGLALAARLATALATLEQPCRVLIVQQLAPELAVDVAANDVSAVCFVDVAVDALGIRLVALDEASEAVAPRLTHEIGPRTLLAYAGILRNELPAAWLLTVGGSAFAHGEELSDAVQSALADDAAIRSVARRLMSAL